MAEMRCVKIRLKPGMVGRTREWAAEINRRKDEALATLRDEGVTMECAFLDSGPDGDFLIYFMKARDLDHAARTGQSSAHDIDTYHQAFKEGAWESGGALEPLIDLELINRDG